MIKYTSDNKQKLVLFKNPDDIYQRQSKKDLINTVINIKNSLDKNKLRNQYAFYIKDLSGMISNLENMDKQLNNLYTLPLDKMIWVFNNSADAFNKTIKATIKKVTTTYIDYPASFNQIINFLYQVLAAIEIISEKALMVKLESLKRRIRDLNITMKKIIKMLQENVAIFVGTLQSLN